jgi:hypothetical protein
VLPEEPEKLGATLGRWLKDHLQKRRNTVRFLLPRFGALNAFQDRDLLILARAEMKALEWSSQSPEYKKLHTKYQGELRDILKKRFDRFTVLHRWNFTDPSQWSMPRPTGCSGITGRTASCTTVRARVRVSTPSRAMPPNN